MPPEGQVPTDGNDGQVPPVTPQAGATNPNPADNKAASPQADDDVSKKVKRANEEAAASRIRAKAAEDALQKLQDSLKTEDERKSERLKQLELAEATWRDRERASNKKVAIALAVAKADTADPDVMTLLLDRAQMDYDDDGAPSPDSLSEAITAILSEKSYLRKLQPQVAPEPAATPKATSAGAPTNMQRKQGLSMATIAKMSNEEINANWEAVNAVLQASAPKVGANQFDYINSRGE